MKLLYYTGRTLQVIGLVLMPSAIWVGHFGRNERGAITIFIGSFVIFWAGWLLARR